ncbi:RSVR protein, partial [Turnix velox]|nr:RSVR protein [Turnix velox]
GHFQCRPGDFCYPEEWRCDGHPDCKGEEDEQGCGTPTEDSTWLTTPPGHTILGTGERGGGRMENETFTVHFALLSVLVAAGSVAVWCLNRAKSRCAIFSLERASRELLMPDKSP